MASDTMGRAVTILEHSRVSPPPGTNNKSIKLTFLDIFWLLFPPVHCLLFYEFPNSSTQSKSLIPDLKHSLSLALKHFFPFAGNLILFPSSTTSKPEIRYLDGDSVPLTFAVCTSDFDYFVGNNNPRNVDEFVPLTPQLPSATKLPDDSTAVPLLAIQVTFFPNKGICMGFTVDHVVGDASTVMGFKKAWASIHKQDSEGPFLASDYVPFYDRSIITDSKGLLELFWSKVEKMNEARDFQTQQILPTLSNMVRASFVLRQSDIQRLKKLVLEAQQTKLFHVSSFVVTCGYVWSCLAKSRAAYGEETHEDEEEHFVFVANARARFDPPLPETYFGNCLAMCFSSSKSIQLLGEEGFLTSAKVIGEAVSNRVHSEDGVLNDADNWISKLDEIKGKRGLSVNGSPKFQLDDIDFGWGKPKKCEVGYDTGSMSLYGSMDSEGGLEVGLSLPKNQMDAFATIFADGLKD
ncbi:hypothetical protein LguiA_033442 [Lonicera macranthoides]